LAVHSQDVAQVPELLQGLGAPALRRGDPAARAAPPFGALGPLLGLALPGHVDGEGPAVELQHSLLEDGGGGEEEQSPDHGEGPVLEAPEPGTAQAAAALVLPRAQLLQTA